MRSKQAIDSYVAPTPDSSHYRALSSTQLLETRCLATDQCIAFTSGGEFKNHLLPPQQWQESAEDLYVAGEPSTHTVVITSWHVYFLQMWTCVQQTSTAVGHMLTARVQVNGPLSL